VLTASDPSRSPRLPWIQLPPAYVPHQVVQPILRPGASRNQLREPSGGKAGTNSGNSPAIINGVHPLSSLASTSGS
jgi:hypothetical protein